MTIRYFQTIFWYTRMIARLSRLKFESRLHKFTSTIPMGLGERGADMSSSTGWWIFGCLYPSELRRLNDGLYLKLSDIFQIIKGIGYIEVVGKWCMMEIIVSFLKSWPTWSIDIFETEVCWIEISHKVNRIQSILLAN